MKNIFKREAPKPTRNEMLEDVKKEFAGKIKEVQEAPVVKAEKERIKQEQAKKDFAIGLCKVYKLTMYFDQSKFETKEDPYRYFCCREDKIGAFVQYFFDNYLSDQAKKALYNHHIEPQFVNPGIHFFDSFILTENASSEFLKSN